MTENEELWREENAVEATDEGTAGSDLRGVGVSPGGMDADLGDMEDFDADEDLEGMDDDMEVGSPSGGPDVDLP